MAVAPPRHPGADREAESFSRWFAPLGFGFAASLSDGPHEPRRVDVWTSRVSGYTSVSSDRPNSGCSSTFRNTDKNWVGSRGKEIAPTNGS